MENTADKSSRSGKSSMVGRITLLLCLCAAIAYAGAAYWQTKQATNSQTLTESESVRATGLIDSSHKKLSPEFSDVHGNLVADAPTDPSKWIDPAALCIGHLEDADSDTLAVDWKQFDAHLSQITGKPVTDISVDNGPSQIDSIKSGKINIMALHGVDAPFLVNNCGFEPVAVLGDDAGVWGNKFDLIVPANSSIGDPSQLKGKTLTCTGPRSIVGYRGAIVLLLQNQGLRPNVDYYVAWSMGQTESIEGVAHGAYEIAAVSDEKLHSLLHSKHEEKRINESQYKVLYQSDVFPRTTIGYFYNLKPDLAAKVRDAVLSYKPEPDDSLDDTPRHFLPVDYKKDFALVREIDNRFDPRLEPKPVKHASFPTTMPASLPAATPAMQ
jgi:phosphonate transport system substrate-binding protein